MSEYKVKSNSELKDFDAAQGILEVYANVYNIKDSHGDISIPGSFNKTVLEQKHEIIVLRNHKEDHLMGVPTEFDANDPYGLRSVLEFNMKNAVANDTYNDVVFRHQKGQSVGVSIGAWVMKRGKNKADVLEYKLKEISVLPTLLPSNHLSVITSYKSESEKHEVIKYLEEMYNLPYSDKRLIEVENILKSLTKEPDQCADTTPEDKPIVKSIFELLALKQCQN
ncbi:MAG: HK97 family phage prohead protease [Sphingobacterium hotanense]